MTGYTAFIPNRRLIWIPKTHAVIPEVPLHRLLEFMYSAGNIEDIIHLHKQNTTHMKQP